MPESPIYRASAPTVAPAVEHRATPLKLGPGHRSIPENGSVTLPPRLSPENAASWYGEQTEEVTR